MYGLSPDTDLSPLNHCTLTFVGFGQYQLQLGFSGDEHCAISVEGDYIVTAPGRQPIRFSEAVNGAAVLLPLLGHTVTVAEVPSDGTVSVGLDDGSVIEVLDSRADYESFQVNLGDRLLVV